MLRDAVVPTRNTQPAQDTHMVPCLSHQGQQTQGHLDHPQQVHVEYLYEVLFGQPLIGCRGHRDASIIHQAPESWHTEGREEDCAETVQ